VLELVLRITALRGRFFWNVWNVFDLIVIVGSVVIASFKYILLFMEQKDGDGTLDAHYTTILRLVSRVAIGVNFSFLFSFFGSKTSYTIFTT